MRTGKIMDNLRTVGVVVALLAAVLLAGPSATAAPAQDTATRSVLADRSCTVTTQWTCVTAPLWVNSGANPHIATLGIPWTAPKCCNPPPINSFVIVRQLDAPGDPEILRDNSWFGAQHDIWSVGWPAGNYRAELHCPYSCQGASLYFDN
jgi:hypothetical protein